jgi:hypothetical protein
MYNNNANINRNGGAGGSGTWRRFGPWEWGYDRFAAAAEGTTFATEGTSSSASSSVTMRRELSKEDQISMAVAVDNFLLPLKEEMQRALAYEPLYAGGGGGDAAGMHHHNMKNKNGLGGVEQEEEEGQKGVRILRDLCFFIGEPDTIYTIKAVLRKIYSSMQYNFNIKGDQSDLEDYLDHKPSEILGFKAIQAFVALVLADSNLFCTEMDNFRGLIQDRRIVQDMNAHTAYVFLHRRFQRFYEYLLGGGDGPGAMMLGEEFVDVEDSEFFDMPVQSQCIIHALNTLFLKQLKVKPSERLATLKKVRVLIWRGIRSD